ncbi:MAG: hypothetical protein C0508_00945 [Cyanobacteria bacterium PR.023]|nr:hypothetical protein [Cyanobacteria bacterium PR.3.49]MBA4073573.1 hypothetical protein [Cyanobacteria bacterium PR.023]
MKVELGKFIQAFESWANRDFDEYYFDKNTGDILSADITASQDPAKFAMLERTPARFTQIKPLTPSDISLLMDNFIATLTDVDARQTLEELLIESGTYEDFKLMLSDFPAAKSSWKQYHQNEMEQFAKSWLKNHNLTFTID